MNRLVMLDLTGVITTLCVGRTGVPIYQDGYDIGPMVYSALRRVQTLHVVIDKNTERGFITLAALSADGEDIIMEIPSEVLASYGITSAELNDSGVCKSLKAGDASYSVTLLSTFSAGASRVMHMLILKPAGETK